MSSKYVDTTAIMQVIGNVYKDPSLLDLTDKYTLTDEDFPDQFHKIVFGSIFKLHELGAQQITLSNIVNFLSTRPKSEAIFKQQKGEEWLTKILDIVTPESFNYYYDRVKKFSLLRAYDNIGLNITDIYDPDNILDAKKRQAQEDNLDNSSLAQIANLIDQKIDSIKLQFVDDCYENSEQAGEEIDSLIESFKFRPEVGVPLYGPFINTVTRGARLRTLYLRSAATGTGKALPNSTIIPTPSGLKKVEEIKPGDYLFDAFGKPTLVKAIYPQGLKEVWEVTFKDGRKAKCCEEHLWSYCTEGQRKNQKLNRKFYTKTLKEIKDLDLYQKGHGYKILVPMQKAAEYPIKQYYLQPYTFGLLLGDGSFRYNSDNKGLQFSSETEELPSAIAKEMNWNYKKCSDYNYTWMFEDPNNNTHTNVWVEEALKDFPMLWQKKSETKFIPREYLEGSIEQRFDLLNGLLDSDGSIDKEKGRISFYTVSEELRDNVIELSFSLGFKAIWSKDGHKDSLPLYKIEIIGTPEDKVKLFKLKRKHELIEFWYNNGKTKELNLFNPIIKIEKLNYSEEMTCFYVDNEEHLFLMNDYIVTHNTRSMIADACYIGCNRIYDDLLGWIKTGAAQPTLFIATEQDREQIQTMMLAFLSNVNEEHILSPWQYVGDEEDRVKEAAKIIKESPLYIYTISDFSLQDIENIIKKSIRDKNIHYVFFDYIKTSIKILEEITRRSGGVKLREDNILFMLSNKLKSLCNKYGIFIMTATQLNGSYQDSETPDQNLLRGAKSIADEIDWGAILLKVKKQDLDALDTILSKSTFAEPTIKMSIYKNRRGKYNGIYLWCKADLGCCRIQPMFATGWDYELIQMDDIKIKLVEESAF